MKQKSKVAGRFSPPDALCSLVAQLRIQFSTDLRVQKMFEILLDENSDKEKREKVRTALDLAKWLLDIRGCTREQSPEFPSPHPLDGG